MLLEKNEIGSAGLYKKYWQQASKNLVQMMRRNYDFLHDIGNKLNSSLFLCYFSG